MGSSLGIPLVVWVAVWVQLLPILVALAWRRRLARQHWGLVIWLVLLVAADFTAWAWVRWWHLGNNMLVSYFFMPLQSAAILWALAEWQVDPVARLATRYCIPLIMVWWGINIFFFEDRASFSVLGSPVYGFIALVAALTALVTRAIRDPAPLLRTDWAWIIGGLAIYFATNATVTILQAAATAAENWVLLINAITLKSVIDVFAMLCIAGGFFWLAPQASSGVSSSPVPSR